MPRAQFTTSVVASDTKKIFIEHSQDPWRMIETSILKGQPIFPGPYSGHLDGGRQRASIRLATCQ